MQGEAHPLGLLFWAEALAIPLLALILNLIIRKKARIPATGAADFLMVFIIFDTIALFRYHAIARAVSPSLSQNIVPTLVFMLFAGMVVWTASVLHLEPLIEQGYDRRSGRYNSGFPLMSFCLAWAIAAAVSGAHAMLFLWE